MPNYMSKSSIMFKNKKVKPRCSQCKRPIDTLPRRHLKYMICATCKKLNGGFKNYEEQGDI